MELNKEDYSSKFPNIFGQKSVLKKISFLLENHYNSGYFPPILISGQLGAGKTILGKAICKNLYSIGNKESPKSTILVNCSTLQSLDDFFDQLVIPNLIDSNKAIIMDEFHSLSKTKVIDALLSIWDSEGYINEYTYGGQTYLFDSRKLSWICLTSEPHLLPDTLLSRMEILELEELKINDLALIISKKLKDIKYDKDLLLEIATYGRNNGRICYRLGEKIRQFLDSNNEKEFRIEHWEYIKQQLGLRPDGITNLELRLMNCLKNYGNCSLTKLSAALQLTCDATRRSSEKYLLANNYLSVLPQKGRSLTPKGIKYLEMVKE